MFTDMQFFNYIDKYQIKKEAREYLIRIRDQQASRMVGVHATTNSCSWLYSEKTQRTISTESQTAERAYVILAEYDNLIEEVWDQPEAIPIRKHSKKGKQINTWYTPDFLVLKNCGPTIVEVKHEKNIANLLNNSPLDWLERPDGSITYLPAKNYFGDIGLNFEVWVGTQELRFRVLNTEMLLRTRSAEKNNIAKKQLRAVFDESFSWSLYNLKERLKLDCYTGILQAIDNRQLFCDLNTSLISEPHNFYIVKDKKLLEYIEEFREIKIYQDGFLSQIDIKEMPSSEYAAEALARLDKIKSNESGRSIRRWKSLIKEGEENNLSEFQSLIPKWYLGGNKEKRINPTVDNFLIKYLLGDHASSQGLSDYRSYIKYRVDAQICHPNYPPVCRTTFLKRLRSIPPEKIAMKRGGKRLANAAASPSDPLDRQLKAELGWQRAAIDHYLADVFLIFFDSDGIVHVQKPWLTAMIDLATGCVLAFSISFLHPSRRSCAKVMRDCSRRHGLLPKEIIIDRGSDFKSVYFSALLAHSKIELILRPAGHSRYGGEIEGLFGEFKKQWLTQRPGNTADYKEARAVDGKKAPKESAVLTLRDFYKEFEAFINWRDSNPKGITVESPKNLIAKHAREYPFVAIPQIYNDEYALATAVDSQKYKINFQRGLHIGSMWYWSPEIKELTGRKSSIEVRIDPENPHVVYGLIDNKWCPCYSSHINKYSALDITGQWIDGLIALEAFNDRKKIKQSADEEIVRIVRRMSEASEKSHQSQIAYIEQSKVTNEESVFDLLKNTEIQPLTTDTWEVKYEQYN
jgi:transposase InsO family protein